ncbi:MAG: Ig-like domain-containing protein [Pseudomonadota bacterium]
MGRVNERTVTGVLVGDQREDNILLLQDLNGDGDASDDGEITVFFDETNLSGLASPTGNIFNVHQASDKTVYAGDGNTDTVYSLKDLNNDGDANDAGEASVWFSAANAGGLTLPTPNGIHEGPDGAIYIVNAGTFTLPADAVYRTVDLNGDGDAEDAGEATVWADLQALNISSSAFDIEFVDGVAYLTDTAGSDTNVVWRLEDSNGDGTVSVDEASVFIDENNAFGVPIDFGLAADPDGNVYTLSFLPNDAGLSSIFRLTDSDGSGQIDDASEAVEVWNSDALPAGFDIFTGFSVAADEDGNLALTANGIDTNIATLTDLNGDGDFLDEGETLILASSQVSDPLDRGRAVAFYEGVPDPAPSLVGTGNQFSAFIDTETNTLFTTGANFFGQLGNGETGFNIEQPRAVALPEGFDETITSVAVGQIHTTFLTDAGDVYSFGFNLRGPLGLGDEEIRTTPTKIEGVLDDETVVGVETGNGVSFAITDTGALYSWGSNTNGQLGLGDREERLVPTRVEALADETVVAVSSGTSYTLVLTADGQVYGFGTNRDGQLGSPDGLEPDGSTMTRVLSPVLAAGLPSDIVAITADTNTSYAVTSDGRVFGWGESRFGQLLVGTDLGDGTFTPDTTDVLVPIELTALPDNVIDVKGGARWGAALTAEGDVYLWGPNDEGPTGGLDGDPLAETDSSFFPVKIAELDDPNIVEIQTGPNAIVARAEDGRLFTWGINGDGRLGFDSNGETVYFPQEIELEEEISPWLVSATPADNDRDVSNDASLTLTFTEPVYAGDGVLRLVNRDTGETIEIDVNDKRLVDFDGTTVTVTPPEHLDVGTRYAVEIEAGAFRDGEGNPYAGIDEGDTSTFNFTTSDVPAGSPDEFDATFRGDLLRGGADDDKIWGGLGDDLLSGAGGNDKLIGGFGDDGLFGGAGNDKLLGGFGDDLLSGGADDDVLKGGFGKDRLDGGLGDDVMRGGFGRDTFVYNGGHDEIKDFDPGGGFFFFKRPGDKVELSVDGVSSFEEFEALAEQVGRDVVVTFSETDSLTFNRTKLSDLDDDDFAFF